MSSVRRATASDRDSIVHMNAAMALETEGVALDRDRLSGGVTAALADPSKAFYLLAERGGEVVGQLMVTTEWSDWRNGVFWWIQSVYITPSWRRRGVYRALYAQVLSEAEARDDVCGVRLYVHHDNTVAQATYESLGMVRSDYHMYEVDFVVERSTPEQR